MSKIQLQRRPSIGTVLVVAALVSLAWAVTAFASPGDTTLVSVDSAGNQADGISGGAALSTDGRYVAFASSATNLVPDDTNGFGDIFVRDRQTGTTERVSVTSAGGEGNDGSSAPSISADGRFVAFTSNASNLVSGDTNGTFDAFVHDRQTGTTERVSTDSAGDEGNDTSFTSYEGGSLSADGRFVAFESSASNLVADDSNGTEDVFVRDRQTGTTERVSVDDAGVEADGYTGDSVVISPDGRFVGFTSQASNLVPLVNGNPALVLHDRQTGTNERVDVSSDETASDGGAASGIGSISSDNRYVSFCSRANNLVPGDSNDEDIYVRDRQAGTTELVSVDSAGNQSSVYNHSAYASMSSDGRYVAWWTGVPYLVPDDTTNGTWDIFVHDRQTGVTERADVDSSGSAPNASASGPPAVSADGRFVGFSSAATNLVTGDTNGQEDVFVHELGEPAPPVDSAHARVGAGGTARTNSSTSPSDPVGTSVTTPTGGVVTIQEGATTTPDPTGYSLLGQEVQITAPTETSADPLVLTFRLDASILPPGATAANVQVFRDGTVMPDCDTGAGTSASPDPCVAGRATTANGIELTVRTSQASTWNFGVSNVDNVPPETTITGGPSGKTNDATPTFDFTSSEPGSTFECRVDGAAFAPCSSPKTLAAKPDGPHTFRVRATDAAGNTDASPAVRTFTVDTHAPETTITSGPSGKTKDATPTFGFNSSEAGSSFECRVDGAAFAPCSSPKTLAAQSDGTHTFRVRARDAAGNVDASPATRTFIVDTHAPETTITGGPSGNTRDRTPTFSFNSSESGSTFECRVDGAAFAPCSSPKTLATQSYGGHTFRVRATDAAGNTDPTAAARTFTVTH